VPIVSLCGKLWNILSYCGVKWIIFLEIFLNLDGGKECFAGSIPLIWM